MFNPHNELDQHSNQMNSDTDDLSNDYLMNSNSFNSNNMKLNNVTTTTTGGAGSSKTDDISKAKKNLEKFYEDEVFGEMATQAMPLFSNLNYPNLKNEIPDLNERFKHVQKMWRKLDGPTKLTYVNKSRQNRYKKKSDDKVSSGGTSSKQNKSLKSPSNNSDKHSDIEQFSRSATPSTMISMEDTNDTKTNMTSVISNNTNNNSNNNSNQAFITTHMIKQNDINTENNNNNNNGK